MDKQTRQMFKTIDKRFVMYLINSPLIVRIDDYYIVNVTEQKRFCLFHKDKELYHENYFRSSDKFSYDSAFIKMIMHFTILCWSEYKNVIFYKRSYPKNIVIKTCRSKDCSFKCSGVYMFGVHKCLDVNDRFNRMFSLFGSYMTYSSLDSQIEKEVNHNELFIPRTCAF